MNKALVQLEYYLNAYKRGGGKQNRAKQAQKMRRFVEHMVVHEGIKGLEQIGRKQVNRFYRKHAHYSPAKKQSFYYAIRTIWRDFLQRGDPPMFK